MRGPAAPAGMGLPAGRGTKCKGKDDVLRQESLLRLCGYPEVSVYRPLLHVQHIPAPEPRSSYRAQGRQARHLLANGCGCWFLHKSAHQSCEMICALFTMLEQALHRTKFIISVMQSVCNGTKAWTSFFGASSSRRYSKETGVKLWNVSRLRWTYTVRVKVQTTTRSLRSLRRSEAVVEPRNAEHEAGSSGADFYTSRVSTT